MNYRFTVAARIDLVEGAQFYDTQRDGLGTEFLVEVGVGVSKILDAPKRRSQIEPGVHKYNLRRFPYGVIYRILDPQFIEVVAVFDLRRRPGGWKDPR
jgi:hypothetical protein